jgi:hypothetical protein
MRKGNAIYAQTDIWHIVYHTKHTCSLFSDKLLSYESLNQYVITQIAAYIQRKIMSLKF